MRRSDRNLEISCGNNHSCKIVLAHYITHHSEVYYSADMRVKAGHCRTSTSTAFKM